MEWIDVNMKWSTRDAARGHESRAFIKAVDDAKAEWIAMGNIHPYIEYDNVRDFLELDDTEWSRPTDCDSDESLAAWLDKATAQANELPAPLDQQAIAIVKHRYEARRENRFVDDHPAVVAALMALNARNDELKKMQFRTHPMCKVGVQILVQRESDGVISKMLIGDIVPGGMDSGCCCEGIADGDIVLRYRDMSALLDV